LIFEPKLEKKLIRGGDKINFSPIDRIKADVCPEKLWFVRRKSRKFPENEVQMQ
jgi:hypothetical protein